MPQPDLYGIVLAGGSARRLSGVDKPMLTVTEVRASARQAADVNTDADLRRAREAHGG